MLKLLVIDDQRKDLEGICGILKWDALGIEICGKASNGQEGLLLAIELKPDIIITDVIMPIMDGLAMQEEILKTHPDTKFIITSLYSDFNYAKKALNCMKELQVEECKKETLKSFAESLLVREH